MGARKLMLVLVAGALALMGFVTPAFAATSDDAQHLDTVKVGVLGATIDIPMVLGKKQGIFEDHGIALELVKFNSGAAMIPAVMNGHIQFGNGNFLTVMIAAEKGLPLKIVAASNLMSSEPSQDFSSIVVGNNSDITSVKQLAGKRVAVNALKNITELAVRGALRINGVDPDGVKLVEIPFPQIAQAISQGNAAAGLLVSPLTEIFSDQVHAIYHPFSHLFVGEPVGGYVTSKQFANSDADLVGRFFEALTEASDYANQHPKTARALLPDYMGLPPEVTDIVPVPVFGTTLKKMPKIVKAAKRADILQKTPDYATLFWHK